MSIRQIAKRYISRLNFEAHKPSLLASLLVVGLVVVVCAVLTVASCVNSSDITVEKEDTAFAAQSGSDALGEAESVSSDQTCEDEASADKADSSSTSICVYVSGCVVNPGVYCLNEHDRVADAITAAGGPLDSAELDVVNLARKIVDGEQIHVPSTEDVSSGVTSSVSGTSSVPGVSSKVNINTADVGELVSLDGIGESTANKIIEDRNVNGPFASIEDIKRVSGIGDKKFEAIKDHICV